MEVKIMDKWRKYLKVAELYSEEYSFYNTNDY